MNITLFFAIWIVLGLATLALALYRKFTSANEEDLIHLADGEEHCIPEQTVLAEKLALIDRWGKILTIITVVTGLGLAGIYLHQVWLQSGTVTSLK